MSAVAPDAKSNSAGIARPVLPGSRSCPTTGWVAGSDLLAEVADRICVALGNTVRLGQHTSRGLTYSGFQIGVWLSMGRKRCPWHCLALTPPSPGGSFAQKVGFEANLLTFNALSLSTLLSTLNFW